METRRVKFKARCSEDSKYKGEWVEGGLVQCDDGTCLIIRGISDNCKITYHVDTETVCEYTGLKDIDDREIWEHDIIVGKPIGTNVAEVRYNRGHYGLFGINSETEFINLSNVDLLENNKLNYFKVIDSIFNYKK